MRCSRKKNKIVNESVNDNKKFKSILYTTGDPSQLKGKTFNDGVYGKLYIDDIKNIHELTRK